MSHLQFWSALTVLLIGICWTRNVVSENVNGSRAHVASSCSEEPIGEDSEVFKRIAQSQNCGHKPGCLSQLECVLAQSYPKRDYSIAKGLGRAGTYGEITPQGVAAIFDSMGVLGAAMGPDDAFFDLGSGAGKMVVQSHLTTRAGSSIGIELDVARHQQATRVYDSLMAAATASSKLPPIESHIGFIQGDVLDASLWANASAIYASVLCFPPDMLVKLSWLLADALQPGAVVFSLMPLPGCHRGLWHVGSIDARMTWAKKFEVHVYVVPPSPFAPPTWLSVEEGAWEASRREDVVVKDMTIDGYVSGALQQWDCNRGCTKTAVRRSFVSLIVRKQEARRINGLSDISGALSESDLLSAIMGKLRGHQESAPDCFYNELEAVLEAQGEAAGSLVKKLMGSIVNVNLVSGGTTVFHALARSFMPTSVAAETILEHGADVGVRDQSGKTPLSYAAQLGHIHLIETMLIHGADVNAKDNVSYLTPLHEALRFSKRDAINALLEAGADANALDSSGKSPLHLVRDGQEKTAQSLIEHHADTNLKDRYGKSPLHRVADMRSTSLLKALLEFRADVNTQDSMGDRPLHASAGRGLIDAALALLGHNADINARSEAGVTALAQATITGHIEMVRTLIIQKASPNIGDRAGNLPLLYARNKGHAGLLEALQNGMRQAQEL